LLLLLLLGVVVGWGVASDRPPRGVEDWCARRGVGDSGREGGIGRGAHCLAFGTALLGDGLAGCFGDGGQVVLLLLCWACLLLLLLLLLLLCSTSCLLLLLLLPLRFLLG